MTARVLLLDAVLAAQNEDQDRVVRNTKRADVRNKLPECKNGAIGAFNDDQVRGEYSKDGGLHHVVLGKNLVSMIRSEARAQNRGNASAFGKVIPNVPGIELAGDLRDALKKLTV